jgi:hypothetical protein
MNIWRCSSTIVDLSHFFYPLGKDPRYPLDRKLGRPQCQSGRCGVEKNLLPLPGIDSEPNEETDLTKKNSRSRSQDGSVGVATGCFAGRPRFPFSAGARFLSSSQCPDRLWCPPDSYTTGKGGCASTAEVKNGGAVPRLPHMPSWHGA